MHLVGFIIRIYCDAQSPERQTVNVRMHIETTANAIFSCMIEAEKTEQNKIIQSCSFYVELCLVLKQFIVFDV